MKFHKKHKMQNQINVLIYCMDPLNPAYMQICWHIDGSIIPLESSHCSNVPLYELILDREVFVPTVSCQVNDLIL